MVLSVESMFSSTSVKISNVSIKTFTNYDIMSCPQVIISCTTTITPCNLTLFSTVADCPGLVCLLQSSRGPPYHVFYRFKKWKISFVKCSNSGKVFLGGGGGSGPPLTAYMFFLESTAPLYLGEMNAAHFSRNGLVCRECTCGTFKTGCW